MQDEVKVTQWRKKPVVVEAMIYPGHSVTGVDTLLAFEEWIEPLAKAAGRWPLTYRGQSLIIPTLEGDHEAKPGDYIIRGVSGEIYPCKPDIFEQTYEPAHRHQAEQRGGDVVAWLYTSDNGKKRVITLEQWAPHIVSEIGATETPLYAHPTPKADAMREALVRIQNEGDARSNAIAFSQPSEKPHDRR